jgi:hypothetical protein
MCIKTPPTLQNRSKNFVEFSQKPILYEFSPTGNTDYIFIFQEDVCRGK